MPLDVARRGTLLELLKMPTYLSGVGKTVTVSVTNPTGKSFVYTAELYLGLLKAASSGVITFTLAAGETRDISYPVAMPSEAGTYPVFLDVHVAGQLIGAFQATEDVIILALNAELVNSIQYYDLISGGWSSTRNWYYNQASLARFTLKNTSSIRVIVGIAFMGIKEGFWIEPGQIKDWEIGPVQPQEGTHTYPYYIYVMDSSTGEEWIVEEGNLTITGVYF